MDPTLGKSDSTGRDSYMLRRGRRIDVDQMEGLQDDLPLHGRSSCHAERIYQAQIPMNYDLSSDPNLDLELSVFKDRGFLCLRVP